MYKIQIHTKTTIVMATSNDTKYDRQLRLWASSGQSNLENSHICLVNATSTGTEILKNLVLPGIGKFTIIDVAKVDDSNLQGNFFLNRTDLGKLKAEAITKKLMELNPDVKGFAIQELIESLNAISLFWDQFDVVIVLDYTPNLSHLIDILWGKKIPLVVVNTLGYYGSVNLIANEITVTETHDPNKLFVLRIDTPWPELQQFVDSIKLDELDEIEHAHIPYLIIFIKALNAWKNDHNGSTPVNYSEKKEFKTYVENLSYNKFTEENFIEGLSNLHRVRKTEIPSSIENLFESSNIKSIDTSTPIYWIYVKALKEFVDKYQFLPLPGNLPDMVSDTTTYVQLRDIYQNKALKDQKLLTDEIHKILKSVGKSIELISPESIKSFCKNTHSLYVTVGSKELTSSSLTSSLTKCDENDDENHYILPIYYAILTFNEFINLNGYRPGVEDLDEFVRILAKTFNIDNVPTSIDLTFREVLSHNASDYHNLNSLMGGIVSQEVLKLTTSQYTPLDNLFVFDGIKSKSARWKV